MAAGACLLVGILLLNDSGDINQFSRDGGVGISVGAWAGVVFILNRIKF